MTAVILALLVVLVLAVALAAGRRPALRSRRDAGDGWAWLPWSGGDGCGWGGDGGGWGGDGGGSSGGGGDGGGGC